ncbi:MAG TPA: hypothetical protein VN753_16785 [Terracidiphilus sp.]|nr:hypothetical protein [Terracidiphilus sp.]
MNMEADWEFEIGGGAPLIEAYWGGFVDLRARPGRVSEIKECHDLPGLADVLLKLNGVGSPVWTSKTDVFLAERVDPDEMNANDDETKAAIACYLDLLPRMRDSWSDAPRAEEFCRQICGRLAAQPLRCCRIDIVVRRTIFEEAAELGTTVYATACGALLADAKQQLAKCLAILATALVGH